MFNYNCFKPLIWKEYSFLYGSKSYDFIQVFQTGRNKIEWLLLSLIKYLGAFFFGFWLINELRITLLLMFFALQSNRNTPLISRINNFDLLIKAIAWLSLIGLIN